MDNFSHIMEGSPSSNDQNYYMCRLCFKQFMYHEELVIHQQLHLEQMQLGASLQGSLRQSYYSRPPVYNPTNMQTGSLDSFDSLVQSFRTSVSESQVRSHTDPRSVMPPSPVAQTNMRHHVSSSPASQQDLRNILPPSPASSLPDQRNLIASSPAAQLDPCIGLPSSPAGLIDPCIGLPSSPAGLIEKVIPQSYRSDTDSLGLDESQTNPVESHSPAVCMHSIPSMLIDSRLIENDAIHSPSGDTRSLSVDSHHMTYSSASYSDSLNRGLYSQDLSSKSLTSIASTYTPQSLGRTGEYLGQEERQMFSKPDSYYGLSKTNYPFAPIPEKTVDSYSTNQYGLSKLLSTQQSRYYQQALPGQSLSHYEMDKFTTTPVNYYNQNSVTEAAARASPRIISPKQTMNYGPPPSHTVSLTNHSQYQSSIPKSDVHLTNPVTSSIHQTANDTGPIGRSYPSDNVSSHQTYSHLYKGSHTQSQVCSSIQSHPVPSQHDYELSSEPIPVVNLESKPVQTGPIEFSCYICSLPFKNMNDLSEHMKLHARGMVDQNLVPVKTQSSNLNAELTNKTFYTKVPPPVVNIVVTLPGISSTSPAGQDSIWQHSSPVEVKAKGNLKSQMYGAPSSEKELFSEHKSIHSSTEKFECSICKKVFKNWPKCLRHAALHQRNMSFIYCEVCDKEFKNKSTYLNHMQNTHCENEMFRCQGQIVGTKKAIPLTGGTIDEKFDIDNDLYVDCQVCDKEILREKLIEHLKTHAVHACDKCDCTFVQKTEYVEHLMKQHRRDLDDSSDNRSVMDNSDNENEADVSSNDNSGLENYSRNVVEEKVSNVLKDLPAKKLNKNRNAVIKDLKEKKKEVMKNLKEKQKEIEDLEKQRQLKEKKTKDKPLKECKTEPVITDDCGKVAIVEKLFGNDLKRKTEKLYSTLKFSCSKCEKSFSSNADLSVHVEAHVKDPSRIYCEVCEISYHYKDKGYYIYHMKYHKDYEITSLKHPDKLLCNVCYILIPKEVYITHVKREHSLFSCEICQWSYSGENALVKHMRSIHGGKKYKYYVYVKQSDDVVPVEEKSAPIVYKKLKDIKAEQNSAKDNMIKKHVCKVCEKTFGTKQHFDRHMKVHNMLVDVHFICELCAANFSSRGAYLYHIMYHQNINTDQDALNKDNTKVSIEKEGNGNDDNDNLYSNAKSAFVNGQNMESPLKSIVKMNVITVLNPETGDFEEKEIEVEDDSEIHTLQLFETDINGASSDREIVNRENVENVHKVEPTDLLKQTFEAFSEIIYCKLCNMSLNKNNLSEHIRSHPLFCCNACEYSFAKKNRYIDHQRILHMDEYIAQEISKVELLEVSWVNKLSKLEEKDKRECETSKRNRMYRFLSCPLCTGEFKHDKYVDHIKSHAKLKMTCQFCGEVFSKKNVLHMHENSHERITYSDKELPYPKICPFCDESLFTRECFVSHVSEHTKCGPFKCKKCEFVFTSEKTLDSHVKVKHDQWCKVFWKQDFEGLRFDTRSGRVSEVFSDTLNEIREINELMKFNKKSEIWNTPVPKKVKESEKIIVASQNKIEASEVENSENESNDSVSVNSSDDDYVPEISNRKRSNHNRSDNGNDYDDEYSPRKKQKKQSKCYSNDDSLSEEEYIPKPTRTRKAANGKNLMIKCDVKTASNKSERVIRSSFETEVGASEKIPKRRENVKDDENMNNSKKDLDTSKETRRTRSQALNESFPEKGPECGTADFFLNSCEEHMQTHITEKVFNCPRCDRTFTRMVNMNTHIMYKHKDYKLKCEKEREKEGSPSAIVGRLRTRTGNLQKDSGMPILTSTPIRGSKLLVRVSPLDLDEQSKKMDKNSPSKKDDKLFNQTKMEEISTELNNCNKGSKSLNDMGDIKSVNDNKKGGKSLNDDKGNMELTNDNENKRLTKYKNVIKSLNDFKKNESLNNSNESGKIYICSVCNRSMNRKWNLDQHLKTHEKNNSTPLENKVLPLKKEMSGEKSIKPANRKDVKKKDKESKPFTCKDCSESFKKKRDLYIHTKVHSADTDDVIAINHSRTSEQDSCTTNDNSSFLNLPLNEFISHNETENEKSEIALLSKAVGPSNNASESISETTDLQGFEEVIDKIDEKCKAIRKGKKHVSECNLDDSGGLQLKKCKTDVLKTEHYISNDNRVNAPDEQKYVVQEKSIDTEVPAHSTNGIDNSTVDTASGYVVLDNHNEESQNADDSEIEDKNKSGKVQTSVTKMSTENALSKWKVKVNGILLSQLELNSTKKQEDVANAGMTKSKDMASVSGKSDKRNFECRICGDNFGEETTFTHHMVGHLKESPPYCSICDIYFMAIYPKKRLLEHNKKKHPERKC